MATLGLLGVVIAGQPLLGGGSSGDDGDTEVLGVHQSRSPSASGGPTPSATGATEVAFTISGRLAEVVPGGPSVLVLTVTHRHPFAIVVRTVEVRVADPEDVSPAGPPCLAQHLEVGDFSGAQRLDARSDATIEVPATLMSDAPDACRTAHFPLAFSGTAIRDGGP